MPKLLYKLPMVSTCLLAALTIAINTGSATSQQQPNNHSTRATNQKPATNTYPNEVVKRYVDACVANGGSAAICACTIRELQKKYSLEEFSTLAGNLETGGEIPNSLTEIAMTCLSGNGN